MIPISRQLFFNVAINIRAGSAKPEHFPHVSSETQGAKDFYPPRSRTSKVEIHSSERSYSSVDEIGGLGVNPL